jgi:hypothetical protein
MKKVEVKEVETYRNQWGEIVYPTESSLSMIAVSLSNLENGISKLSVDNNVSDETDLRGVENQLEQLQIGVSNITATLEDIHSTSIDTNNNLELIVMQLSRVADALENKNK